MADPNVVVVNGGKAGWFVAGALIVAALIGGYLYYDGYFDRQKAIELKIEVPKLEIEGQ